MKQKNYTERFGILQTYSDSNFFRKPFNNIKDVHGKGSWRAWYGCIKITRQGLLISACPQHAFLVLIQSDLVNTDIEGSVESVRINEVSVLSGLNLEKMKGVFSPRDKANCP